MATTEQIPNVITVTERDIVVTEKALARIRVVMAKESISPDAGGLRLGVQGGGCSGLTYNVRFDSKSRARDRVYDYDGVHVFVDPKSYIYLKGMILDCEQTLLQQKLVCNNPNASKSCGCSTRFSG